MRQLSLLAMAAVAWAQGPVFEVASVRPAKGEVKGMNIRRDPAGGITATNVNLRTLVVLGYNLQDYQVAGGPGWIESDRFDVVAKAPAEAKKSDTWPMLRALLAERFQLAVHQEKKEMAVYELTVAKGGLKMQEARRPPAEADDWCRQGNGRLQCYMIPMANLAFTLSGILKRQVRDATGIAAKFDFTLEWAQENRKDQEAGVVSDGPSIFTALQEQLGLRLAAAKGAVEVVVVDRAEKPAAN